MPSVSKKQHNFMAAVANNPKFAKKAGVPSSVGKEFLTADKGKTFKQGGIMATKMNHEEKGEMKKDLSQDKKMIKKAVSMHDKQLHSGKKTNLSTLKKGGKVCMARGGGIEIKGKTKGKFIKMNKGGAC
jgi:hypothetical protein